MITLTRLQYFLEAAEAGSFSEAATRLFTTQPNISKQIAQLEQELGIRLFYRFRGQIVLTKAGEYLHRQLGGLLEKIPQTCFEAAAIGREEARQLRVGIVQKAIGYFLQMAVLDFAGQNPQYRIDVERERYDNLCNGFLDLQYDMLLTDEIDLPVFRGKSQSLKLFEVTLAVLVSLRSPLAERERVSLAELRDEPFVLFSPKGSGYVGAQLRQRFQAAGFSPRVARLASCTDDLFIYTSLNEGISLIEENGGMLHSPQLRLLPLDPPVTLSVYALWSLQRSDPLPELLADFIIARREAQSRSAE